MATKTAKKLDALDQLAAADPRKIIALMLWKNRHHNPDMAVLIDEKDLKGLVECTVYLGIESDVRIFRRPAIEPRDAIPAQGKRPAISAFPGAPAAPCVTVCMVAKGTEDTFKPIENNEEDAQKGEKLAELRRLRETTPSLATQVNNAAASGEFSQQLVMELCHAAMALARA